MPETYIIEKQNPPIVLDVAQVIALEQSIAKAGTPLAELMDRAGRSVAGIIIERCPSDSQVVIFCGTGNNGGDGWVCAEALASKGWAVCLISPCPANEIKAEPARSAALRLMSSLESCDQNPSIIIVQDEKNEDELRAALDKADIIVDSMLGTGFSSETLRPPYREWTEMINEEKQKRQDIQIISVDVPSGLSAQTGEVAIPCIKADLTLTMIVCKPGLLTSAGKDLCGELLVANIADIEPFL